MDFPSAPGRRRQNQLDPFYEILLPWDIKQNKKRSEEEPYTNLSKGKFCVQKGGASEIDTNQINQSLKGQRRIRN